MSSFSASVSQTPITTFTLFPHLPLELRLEVWTLALPAGAYIHFHRHVNYFHHSQHIISRCSPFPVPPILHVNAESRSVAVSHLHLLGTGSSQIYFNPAVDTLMMGLLFRVNFASLVERPDSILGENVRLIKHIAVYNQPVYCYWFQRPILENFVEALESFTVLDLKELEDAFRVRRDEGNGERVVLDFAEMRMALKAEVFRAENLERRDEEDLRRSEAEEWKRGGNAPQFLVKRVEFVWKEMSERPLALKVMRLPLSKANMGEARVRIEREGMKKKEGAKRPETEGDVVALKKRGIRFRIRENLGRLLSRMFP